MKTNEKNLPDRLQRAVEEISKGDPEAADRLDCLTGTSIKARPAYIRLARWILHLPTREIGRLFSAIKPH